MRYATTLSRNTRWCYLFVGLGEIIWETPDYPDPKPAAETIRDHVAFWRGVEVSEETASPQNGIVRVNWLEPPGELS